MTGQQRGGRRDSQPLVDYGNTVLRRTRAQTSTRRLARARIFCRSLRQRFDVRRRTVVHVQGQRHRADVEVFGVQHLDRGEDLIGAEHRGLSLSTEMKQC